MKRKLEVSEFIFKLISYVLLTMFAIGCLYPFIYTISSAISGYEDVRDAKIVLFPKHIQFDAFKDEFNDNVFWNSYTNTLFITFYGTIWQMVISVFGAYKI